MAEKILVIDDNAETVHLIEMMLRRYGYEVWGAQSGADGIRKAERERPDLILLDIMMPGMDGLVTCRNIRAHADLCDLPIIMFTAKAQAEDKRLAFEAGANDYLVKPTRPKELANRVQAMLARHSSRMEGVAAAPPELAAQKGRGKEQLIAVVGTRGGAGATTVALNLAVSLADMGQETVLVDLDARQGHVALYLGREVEHDVVGWLMASSAAELDGHLVRGGGSLQLLLSRPHLNHGGETVDGGRMEALVSSLVKPERFVIIDLGRSVAEATHPILHRASHILVCLQPDRVGVIAAKEMLDHLRQLLGQGGVVHALVVDPGWETALRRRSVEGYLRLPLLDVLPIRPAEVARAVDEEVPLVHHQPNSPLASHFRQLAQQLAVSR